MKYCYTSLLCLFFCLSIQTITAQPATTGCHFAHQHAQTAPLTAADQAKIQASIDRSDTFDVLHYDIALDVTTFTQQEISGEASVTFMTKMPNIDYFNLDLLDMTIDRIHMNDTDLNFQRVGFNVIIELPEAMEMGDTSMVTVLYHGRPTTSNSSFGGFYFEGGYAYNLGIDLIGEPHNFGRSWFPCFDNFVERATYDISLKTSGGRSGYAVGNFMGEETIGGDTIVRSYSMQKQLPTYLVGVAVSNYAESNSVHSGAYGDIPVQIVAKPTDLTNAVNSMAFLPDAIDCLEFWYGPYIWNRVGYVITQRGAMEHSSSIAYPVTSISSGQLSTRLMTHELCHHWWGNMITVNYAPDMWIKEGNAEYGAHLIEEYIGGHEPFRTAVRNNHFFVLTTAHEEDGEYLALSPLSQENTYGRHTYYRGASILHNMRAYLGDTLFRSGQTQLLNTNIYSYLNAQAYRDSLTSITGVNMTSYFDDWIFSPGYSDYYLHHFNYGDLTNELSIVIGQNQYESGHFHENAPVPVSLFFEDGTVQDLEVMISGELDSVILPLVPQRPVGISINRGHDMNLAMFEDYNTVTEAAQFRDTYTNYRWTIDEVIDTFSYSIERHLTAPSGEWDSDVFQLSQNHFWHITGTQEGNFAGTLLLFYDDNAPLAPDTDLTSFSEDSIVLMYRPDASEDWVEYDTYTKFALIPTDGKGSMILTEVRNGDYTFANRLDDRVATLDQDYSVDINLFPNPVTEQLNLTLTDNRFDRLQIFSIDGKLYRDIEIDSGAVNISVADLSNGEYFVYLSNDEKFATGQFVVLR